MAQVWHLPTDPARTADEHRLLVEGLLAGHGLGRREIHSAVVASVVPAATPALLECLGSAFGVQPLVIGPGVRSGLPIRYDPPRSLGADRLANAVAATAEFGAPVVVVDLGTACTFTVVDRGGQLVGGAIASGVGLAAEALVAAGARLQAVSLAGDEPPLVGRTTDESVRSGVLYGFAGLVDGLLTRIERELGSAKLAVVATGGLAPILTPLTRRVDALRPRLTLDGPRLLWELNEGAGLA